MAMGLCQIRYRWTNRSRQCMDSEESRHLASHWYSAMTATLTVSPAEVTLRLSMRSIVKGDGHAASRLEPSTDAAEVEMELEAAA